MKKIPKIFHQVWLGKKALPLKFKTYQRTWIENHPDWQLIVWNEKNINELKYFQENDFNNLNNFSEKSDYLRFCIVLEHGGIYIDTDFECLKPIKEIISELSFFIGYDGYFGDKRGCYLNSAIFGATKENPLIREIYFSLHQRIFTGKKLDSVHKIGPGYITKIIENYKGSKTLFSRHIFYPIHWDSYNEKLIINNEKLIQEGSYGIHHYTFSWSPKPLWKRILGKIKIMKNSLIN